MQSDSQKALQSNLFTHARQQRTSMLGINHNVSATDVDAIVKLATKLSVDLVVVGPEAPWFGTFGFLERQGNT